MVRKLAQVVLNREHERLDRLFTYAVPDTLLPVPVIGSRVWVPFGREYLEGFVVNFVQTAEVDKIKEIVQVLGEGPVFNEEQIKLAFWMAEYYMCSLIRAFKTLLPPTSPSIRGEQMVRLAPISEEELLETIACWQKMHPPTARILSYLMDRGEVSTGQLSRLRIDGWKEILMQLENQGFLLRTTRPVFRKSQSKQKEVFLTITPEETQKLIKSLQYRAPRQAEILEILLKENPVLLSDLMKKTEGKRQSLNTLVKKNVVKISENSSSNSNDQEAAATSECETSWKLTPEQNKVFTKIQEALIKTQRGIAVPPILLHGITGSGKTEVYLQAIEFVLAQGRKAIVLVPEISLTPQMVGRFRRRFGLQVALLHSRLTPKERQQEWERIKKDEVKILVGARSAVFAPMTDLGLIVLDEEHENSYKQDYSPRYHAREVAIKRAELNQAVVLLGTATPALETYFQGQKGDFTLLQLNKRARGQALPGVEVVDLRDELKKGNRSIFSQPLKEALEEALRKGEQSILFLNRRGFFSFVNCRQCGLVLRCPNCEIALTYHYTDRFLRCHYCNFKLAHPDHCPGCKSRYLRYFGIGTQRVEEEVHRLFPEARTQRVDIDTTVGRNFYDELFRAFKQRDIDILIGTQLIAKGLDFPGVTLVGVVTADTLLNLPDFRATERTFQLLTQVAGRAGRGDQPGKVIIQTYAPEHYGILTARHQDFEAFYRAEMEYRQQWQYPPFSSLIRILLSGFSEHQVRLSAELLERYLKKTLEEKIKESPSEIRSIQILRPGPAPLSRLRRQYRWQIILKGLDSVHMKKVLKLGIQEFKKDNAARKVNITVDVDPVTML